MPLPVNRASVVVPNPARLPVTWASRKTHIAHIRRWSWPGP